MAAQQNHGRCPIRMSHAQRLRRVDATGRLQEINPQNEIGFPVRNQRRQGAAPLAEKDMTEYTAGSFAQPIRRVFGTLVFRAHESVDMPAPGDMRPARIEVRLRDLVWDSLYLPISGGVA